MTMMFDYRTIATPRVLPPKTFKAIARPTLSFAEQARRDNNAVLASWDRTAPKYSGSKEASAIRRMRWAEALPLGPLGRATIRAAWPDVKDAAADSRIESLERGGFLIRLTVRPCMWERAE